MKLFLLTCCFIQSALILRAEEINVSLTFQGIELDNRVEARSYEPSLVDGNDRKDISSEQIGNFEVAVDANTEVRGVSGSSQSIGIFDLTKSNDLVSMRFDYRTSNHTEVLVDGREGEASATSTSEANFWVQFESDQYLDFELQTTLSITNKLNISGRASLSIPNTTGHDHSFNETGTGTVTTGRLRPGIAVFSVDVYSEAESEYILDSNETIYYAQSGDGHVIISLILRPALGDGLSKPTLSTPELIGDKVRFKISNLQPGERYHIQQSRSLSIGEWWNADSLTPNAPEATWSTMLNQSDEKLFYRLRY